MKNIIAIKNIVSFYKNHPDSRVSLENWIAITKNEDWEKPSDVISTFPNADTLKDNRIVFNIAHNKYRLIVKISYVRKWVFIKFIGSHSEYDKVDANTIENY